MIAAFAWWILAFGLTDLAGASKRFVEGSSHETAPSPLGAPSGATFLEVEPAPTPRADPPALTFAVSGSGSGVVAKIGSGSAVAGATLITGLLATSAWTRAASATRAASRSCMMRSRSAASFSTPSPRASAPTFAPAKRAAKILRTVDSARISPMPIRIPVQATNAPMPVSKLAAPPPAMFPMRPP